MEALCTALVVQHATLATVSAGVGVGMCVCACACACVCVCACACACACACVCVCVCVVCEMCVDGCRGFPECLGPTLAAGSPVSRGPLNTPFSWLGVVLRSGCPRCQLGDKVF